MEIILSIFLFVLGLAILIKGSDFFVDSAAFIARHFGVSKLIIGLTLVSMGTSLPELGASVYASYTGEGGIAVGNVVGSNITNIALVLGICLIFRQISVKNVRRDGLVMLGVSLLFILFVFNGIARWEGLLLMILFVIYMFFLYRQNKIEKRNNNNNNNDVAIKKDKKGLARAVALLVIGCIGVFLGSKLLVDSAVDISFEFGISKAVIGSTLVAFGTSVPELTVSLVAILKKHEDISIGNIIGSNIFNILWVIGAAALVSSLAVDSLLFYINIPIMILGAGLLLIFMFTGRKLQRWEGIVFVAIYAIFLWLNFG
ncbi:MAG: calcium/sodium antiporter [Thermoplasmata archaeon]|nr:MAG: calcium/sodium antiporter [Thermoplasmata archaeon]